MSENRPILVLQMLRMGDLVLTYPLILWLRKQFPGHPVWVVAEEAFYNALLEISPPALYFPWSAKNKLRKHTFHLICNLSHRPEAAQLAGELRSDAIIGPWENADGVRYIEGNWQTYRAGLVNNNRHNRFHWADLNALDIVPLSQMKKTTWPEPQTREFGRIGLFLGASEPEKRPSAQTWGQIVLAMLRRGLNPVLMGGPSEKQLGAQVVKLAKAPVPNLCGRFSVTQFARSLGEIDLLVTPDTGPMHLAAWFGLRCLNLSLGPVNPWETGPYLPGHYVLQAAMSCTGCWTCTHPTPQRCAQLMHPERIAFLAGILAKGRLQSLERLSLPGMRLMRTEHASNGLFNLAPLGKGLPQRRDLLSDFWNSFFGAQFKIWGRDKLATAWQCLGDQAPELRPRIVAGLSPLSRAFSSSLRSGAPLPPDFWKSRPPLMRPLSGYLHMLLQNADFSGQGYANALACVESIAALQD